MRRNISLLLLATVLLFFGTSLCLAQASESSPGTSGGSELLMLFGMFVLAIFLALVELFLIPGFGIAGLASVAALSFCGYHAFTVYGFATGSLVTLVLLVLAIIVVTVAIRIMAKTEAGRGFVLDKSLDGASSGYQSEEAKDPDLWIGRKLKAITDLRPGGNASFEDETIEVFSEGSFLHSGDTLEVTKVSNGKLIVKKLETQQD